ncbi:MAG TPA: 5-formyltetrahydrofolate cyclo-ligase [Pyrinomonadaceae bacterium]|nr:5-formyltetrahydrofolate cyclo-ligase [Pyrinomonadaceae bacterium]
MEKSELRKVYLAKQKSLGPSERNSKSEAIAELFFESFDLSAVACLHCFIPIEKFNEVDTRPIFERLWRDFPQIQTVVPRVDFETNEIRNLKFEPDTSMKRNAWDIDEPMHGEFVESKLIDMVLVPGLCFDSLGFRVGYGKGFYDRFLKTCRYNCVRVGLSYFPPVEEIEDVHDGDVRLDAIVTANA